MKKKVFYAELAYPIGLVLLAFSAALMNQADFGLSMVIAPAYLIHLKVSQFLPFFSFGMAEYTVQAVLLLVMIVVIRKFRVSFLFSFLTAVLYGFVLDGWIFVVSLFPAESFAARLLLYVAGVVLCSFSISFLFHTYIPAEVYEVFVQEVAAKFQLSLPVCKTVYDCSSAVLSVCLSFLFFGFGHFEGVKWGTVLCALGNGALIGFFSRFLEKRFVFSDALPWHRFLR